MQSREKIVLKGIGTPLIKFQRADRIKELQKGHLYAKRLSYYRQLEEETGDSEIGDSYEAMLHINEGYIKFPDTGEIVELKDQLLPTANSDDYVFCMFGVYPTTKNFSFSELQKEKMLSFGDTALIVLNTDEFIRRVILAAQQQGYDAHFGAVQYYNPAVDNANMIISLLQGTWNMPLWKRESYKYQQEGRFVFSAGANESDHLDLYIGDISDISNVVPAKQALTAMISQAM